MHQVRCGARCAVAFGNFGSLRSSKAHNCHTPRARNDRLLTIKSIEDFPKRAPALDDTCHSMSKSHRRLLASGLLASISVIPTLATAAPSGAHPRLWLDSATKQGLAAQVGVADSPVERGHTRCSSARSNPGDYDDGGWQGFEFVTTLSGCLVSYAASGNADDLQTALKYFSVLLDDYQQVGDGAGGDNVVSHDSGYAMRTFAPYSAIAYDWLHDAPGMTE